MQKNLRWKLIVIVATVLISAYGIIGLPKSKEELLANWNQNIRLGLDLKGGSLLVLQVQLQDAFRAEADLTIERMKEQLAKDGVAVNAMERNDPASLKEADQIQINVKGVPLDKTRSSEPS